MPRIFASLAFANFVILVLAAAFGLARLPDRHIPLAVFALLISCFVQVAVVIYLSVTTRMVSQALHLGGFDLSPLARIRRYKRDAMRFVALIMVGIVAVTATGAARWRGGGGSMGEWHLFAVMLSLALHLVAFYRQYTLIVANTEVVDSVLRAYGERRRSMTGQPKATGVADGKTHSVDSSSSTTP